MDPLVDPLADGLVGHRADFIILPLQLHRHQMEVVHLEDPIMKGRGTTSWKGKKGRDMNEIRKEKER